MRLLAGYRVITGGIGEDGRVAADTDGTRSHRSALLSQQHAIEDCAAQIFLGILQITIWVTVLLTRLLEVCCCCYGGFCPEHAEPQSCTN
jgi:hypothetical protein